MLGSSTDITGLYKSCEKRNGFAANSNRRGDFTPPPVMCVSDTYIENFNNVGHAERCTFQLGNSEGFDHHSVIAAIMVACKDWEGREAE